MKQYTYKSGGAVRMEVQGVEGLIAQMRALGPAGLTAGGKSLYESGWEIMTESKDVYCPVDTGALKSTGDVIPPQMEGSRVTVVLGYGGPSADYAVHVHEHDKNYRVGSWKYLEIPLKAGIQNIGRKLKADIEAEFNRTR